MEDIFHLGTKAFIYNNQDKLLLLKANSKNWQSYWDLPGGRKQKGESLEDALKREVYEETGIQQLTKIELLGMYLSPIRFTQKNQNIGLIFALHLCQLTENSRLTLSNEHTSYEWMNPKQGIDCLKDHFPSALIEQIEFVELRKKQALSCKSKDFRQSSITLV